MAHSLTNSAGTRDQDTTDIWLTPPWIIDEFGPFDLDPCACSEPRPWPTAKRHLTVEDDGLLQPWGRDEFVWMNPPYGRALGVWFDKLALQGNGIALVFARTETAAFQQHVWPFADAVIFMRGRIEFWKPDGKGCGNFAGAPSMLIGYGEKGVQRLYDKRAKAGSFFDLRAGREKISLAPLASAR